MKLKSIFTFLISLLWFSPSLASDSQPIRFAALPIEGMKSTSQAYLPFMNYLEQHVTPANDFEFVYKKSYHELVNSFKNGEIDLAYLGPLPYVVLKEQYPDTLPLAQFLDEQGESTYTCALVEFAGDKVDPKYDKNLTVALTQPLSTCGLLSTESLLNEQGLSLKASNVKHEFFSHHSEVALQVILGKQKLGGLKTKTAQKHHSLGLKIISETDAMPGFLLVANSKTLSPKQISNIQNLVLSIRPRESAADFKITENWGPKIKYGAIPVNDNDYNRVREKWKNTQLDLINK